MPLLFGDEDFQDVFVLMAIEIIDGQFLELLASLISEKLEADGFEMSTSSLFRTVFKPDGALIVVGYLPSVSPGAEICVAGSSFHDPSNSLESFDLELVPSTSLKPSIFIDDMSPFRHKLSTDFCWIQVDLNLINFE